MPGVKERLLVVITSYCPQCTSALNNFSVGLILLLQLCSQKGYVCEGCHNSEVIYPFDVDTTYQVTIPPSCPDLTIISLLVPRLQVSLSHDLSPTEVSLLQVH